MKCSTEMSVFWSDSTSVITLIVGDTIAEGQLDDPLNSTGNS